MGNPREVPRIVWGPELSPFLLKLESMLAHHDFAWRRLPRDGSRVENVRTMLTVNRAIRLRTAIRPPANDALDEYPLVPYLVTTGGEVLYDTSALAPWLDARSADFARPLVPRDRAVRFVASILDEAFDEIGLYMVHHNRWKLAATDNDRAGKRLAAEYARFLPPGSGALFERWFASRQIRRLPYLFSVASRGYAVPGLPASRTPPSREGFPPTHELLEELWTRTLAALEQLLTAQPFLLGAAFTIADASVYGQLSMNLTDGVAARRLRELAPRTFDWLCAIRDRAHAGQRGEPRLTPILQPLFSLILDSFVPLMQQNAAAYASFASRGETSFNERAFDDGRCLYDGELLGRPYRSVAKTFQVRIWRDLCAQWAELSEEDRRRVGALAPERDLSKAFRMSATPMPA
jgi:glutathione S-transferase